MNKRAGTSALLFCSRVEYLHDRKEFVMVSDLPILDADCIFPVHDLAAIQGGAYPGKMPRTTRPGNARKRKGAFREGLGEESVIPLQNVGWSL